MMSITHQGDKCKAKSNTLDKTKKHDTIASYEGYEEETILKEYITSFNKTDVIIKKAQTPNREKLMKAVKTLDDPNLEYRTSPVIERGQLAMETVPEVQKKDLLKVMEQIYANESGVIDPNIALNISHQLSTSFGREKMRACIATNMGQSIMVYDWIKAQDPETKERRFIQTWIPLLLTETKYDEHMRLWLEDKSWQQYTKEEKEIFQMQNVMFRISHYWILLRLQNSQKQRKQYMVLPNTFTILTPGMHLMRFPKLNTSSNDISVQCACEVTNDISEVSAKETNPNISPPSKYDTANIQTSLISRMLGKKYNKPKKLGDMEMLLDTSIVNSEAKKRLLECHSYVISANISDEHLIVFDKVFSQLSDNLEPNESIVEMLQDISTPKKKYHLLGFITNSNVWFRYGYSGILQGHRSEKAKAHWIPLSYKFATNNNLRGPPKLNDISNNRIEELCQSITGYNSFEIHPRYFAIGLKAETGYRIIDRQIFDIFTYNKPEDEDLLEEDSLTREFEEKRRTQELLEISVIPSDKPKKRRTTSLDIRHAVSQNDNKKERPKIVYSQYEIYESSLEDDSPISSEPPVASTRMSDSIMDSNLDARDDGSQNATEVQSVNGRNTLMFEKEIHRSQESEDNSMDNNTSVILQDEESDGCFTIVVFNKRVRNKHAHTSPSVKYSEIYLNMKDSLASKPRPCDKRISNQHLDIISSLNSSCAQNMSGQNQKGTPESTRKTKRTDTSQREGIGKLGDTSLQSIKKKKKTEINRKEKEKTSKKSKSIDSISPYIAGTTQKYHCPSHIIPKYITTRQVKELNESLKTLDTSTASKVHYWLSIGERIQSDIPRKSSSTEGDVSARMRQERAQRLFNKGNIGKAYEMIVNNTRRDVTPTIEDLNKLYPTRGCKVPNIIKNNVPFIVNEKSIDNAVKTLKNGKSAGISQLSTEHIKQLYIQHTQREMLRNTVQDVINNPNKVPDQLFTTRLICIPKNNGGIRPLSIEEMLLKVTNKVVNTTLMTKIKEYIEDSQTCLSGTNAQMNAIEKLRDILTGDSDNNNNDNKYIAKIDMTNAFGSIEHSVILRALNNIKGIERLAYYISVFLKRMKIQYDAGDGKMELKDIDRGVPQGDPLSMSLFALGLDCVIKKIKQDDTTKTLSVVAYADDVILITASEKEMEAAMKRFKKEASKIGLTMNPAKTEYYTTKSDASNKYKDLHSYAMEYLGIPISLNQSRVDEYIEESIDNVYSQAEKLWRCSSLTLQARFHIYQTCVLSKLIYLFRGTDTRMKIDAMSIKMEELYKDAFYKVPIEIMRLPVSLGGLGLLYLDDMRQISRLSYLIETGRRRDIPVMLKPFIDEDRILNREGEIQHLITQAYYKWQREKYLVKLRSNKKYDKQLVLMLDDKQTKSAHSLLIAPPTNTTQVMDDYTFKLCIALRYHINILEHTNLRCEKCDGVKSLWHILRCTREQMGSNLYIHEKIKYIIGAALKRNKEIVNVRYEQLSTQDEEEKDKVRKHIPDILLSFVDGKEHSLDICVETKFNEVGLCGYEPTKGLKRKERQYEGTKSEVHPIVFDNSGRINTSSWEYLRGMGIKKGILKYIQALIMKNNSNALRKMSEKSISRNEKILRRKNNGMQIEEAALESSI